MKVLVLLSRVPWPLEKGDKLRAYHVLKELSDRHQLILFCLAAEPVHPLAESKLKEVCEKVYIHRLSTSALPFRLARGLLNALPFQVNYFYSTDAQKAVDKIIENHLPNHIICQLVRTSQYVRHISIIPKSLDYMDALSIGMERMAQRAYFPLNWIMRTEASRLHTYERDIYPHFNHHFIISNQDKKALAHAGDMDVVANGIDSSFLTPDHSEQPKVFDILFTGNMSYRPNVESARFLAHEIMPLVWRTHPTTRLCLAGANPSETVVSLQNERIEVTGWVDDIREYYRKSRVFVAPMIINSGLQNKLLEAMACGLPCVTTTLANNALGAEDSKSIIIADSAEDNAQSIVRLLDSDAQRQSLGAAGQQFVREQFNWKRASDIISSRIEESLA